MRKELVLLSLTMILVACGSSSSDGGTPKPNSAKKINQPEDKYSTDSASWWTTKTPDSAFLTDKMSVDDRNRLQLANADWIGSTDADPGFDAGMNALKNGKNVAKQFRIVRGYTRKDGKVSVYLRDPAVAGWKYQTFGQVINNDNKRSKGYVTIGKAYTPTKSDTITATYKGVAMGTLNLQSEVIANMTATLNWAAGTGNLSVKVTDSKIAKNNISSGWYNKLQDAAYLDFSEKMPWNADQKVFEGQYSQARLYGNKQAREVNGTFDRGYKGQVYQGAFAGKTSEYIHKTTDSDTPTDSGSANTPKKSITNELL